MESTGREEEGSGRTKGLDQLFLEKSANDPLVVFTFFQKKGQGGNDQKGHFF